MFAFILYIYLHILHIFIQSSSRFCNRDSYYTAVVCKQVITWQIGTNEISEYVSKDNFRDALSDNIVVMKTNSLVVIILMKV